MNDQGVQRSVQEFSIRLRNDHEKLNQENVNRPLDTGVGDDDGDDDGDEDDKKDNDKSDEDDRINNIC